MALHFYIHLYRHETKNTNAFCLALLGGLALWSCEKVAPTELRPKAVQTNQGLVIAEQSEKLSPAQLAWTRFVAKVERGEQLDPTGQYVAKATQLPTDEERLTRPKHDVANGFIKGLAIRASGAVVQPGEANKEDQPHDPIVVCDGTVACPGGGGPTVYSTFVSSEGMAPYSGIDNPDGYIHDLKIGFILADGTSECCWQVVGNARTGERDGYTRLSTDLNKGAGGAYIYLAFTRNPSKVELGEMGVLTGSTTPVTGIKVGSYCCFNSSVVIPPAFGYITGEIDSSIEQIDLNTDADGRYIYSFQSKDPAQGTPIEVGVLSGNSSAISPPAGWIKINQDLNEGAGGDFIYFCYKHR